MRLIGVVTMAAATLSPGCGDDDCCVTFPNPDAAGPTYEDHLRIPITSNRDIDVLFVIDDSPGALELQTSLKNNFPEFINALNSIEGGLPNLHLGVASTDLGTKGAADNAAGPGIGSGPGSCSGNGKAGNLQTNGTTLVSGVFINDQRNTDGTRTQNYIGTLADAFNAMASLGAGGCGFEQPIEAAKRALNNNPANAGFVRPNANLAVLFVTEEDDCSFAHSTLLGNDTATLGPLQSFRCTRFGVTCDEGGTTSDEMNMVGLKNRCRSNESSPYLTKVGDYAAFINGLKTNPDSIMVGAIAGPPTPVEVELRTPPGGAAMIPALAHSCVVGTTFVADPAVRVAELASKFDRSSVGSACNGAEALTNIGKQVRLMVGTACLMGPLPTGDCRVLELRGDTETEIPMCGTTQPCWQLVSDPVNCAAAPNQKLQVMRTDAPPPDSVIVYRCRS